MSAQIYDRIRVLIEETNDAFSSCGSVNTDYAEFASMALGEFKHVLGNPKLTRNRLTKILRTGTKRHRKSSPESNWSDFMAEYISRKAANRNRAASKTGAVN